MSGHRGRAEGTGGASPGPVRARSEEPLPSPSALLPEGAVPHPSLGVLLPVIRARLAAPASVVAYYDDAP